jgi:metallo-beta-lactamase family protein
MTKNRPDVVFGKEEILFPDGRIRFLGAMDSVNPAMTLVEIEGITLLVDCGADPGQGLVELPDEAYEVDALLLTHGHLDHVGGIPSLMVSGFSAPIYGSPATLAISRIVLGDGIRLRGGQFRDVRAFLGGFDRIAKEVEYGQPFKLFPNRDIEVTYHNAGHILGSASIEIKTAHSRLLFSGDLGRPGSPLLDDPNTSWDDSKPFDLVIMESTYGNHIHEHSDAQIQDKLLEIIEEAREDGGHIIVPAFALGRTQTLIYHLETLVEAGRLSNLPVALDSPLGLRVTSEYEHFKKLLDSQSLIKLSKEDDPLDFEGLYSVRKTRDSKKLRDLDKTMLIIAGSGMCTGGRVVSHLKELLPYSETNVLFVGYQAPGTLGCKIIEAAAKGADGPSETVTIKGEEVAVRATVDVISSLSGHADKKELAAWLDKIPNVKQVVLYHGDSHAQKAFAEYYKN